ncbi:MAG: hypothetical protein ACI920_002572 [Saprospiraceae bacterium]|jgi:hypothetical protein
MAAKDNYQLLIEKLDGFIRKYYANQMIRGALYFTALVLVLFLGLNFLEHYYYFGSGTRTTLFYSFVGISALAFIGWILMPMSQYFRLGKVISHEKAASIIGEHFGDVKDKLLNVLQLRSQAESSTNRELVLASINQKSDKIKLVPFKNAIDFSQNKRYLRYALPPLMLLLVVLFAAPSLIKDSTARLLAHGEEFERPAPFHFSLENDDLTVVQYEDYPLTVKVDGEVLPNEVFIDVDNYQYRLTKVDANTFTYRFANVQKETDFKLFSSGVNSADFELKVLKKPNILGFEVKLNYPNYTGRRDEDLNSIGDLVVPQGTTIDWVFNSENTDEIAMQFSKNTEITTAKRFSDELFTYKKKAIRDETYELFISNDELPNADSITYTISVIPDLYPTIKAEKFQDSLDAKLMYFVGDANDDYGLLSVSFNYEIKKEKGSKGELQRLKLNKPKGRNAQFTHTFDVALLELEPGDEVNYYFETFDNDGVNGSKSARTNLMVYEMPTIEEFEEMEEENDQEVKDKLQKSVDDSKKLQEDMKKMREKLLQEKDVDWQMKKEIEKLLERQKEMEKQVEEAKEAFEENLKNQEEFTEQDKKIMEKQEKLQKMFEEVMSEEMKKLMEEIEALMEEMEKDDALEKMEEMEMNDEELEDELDRMLELYKQLEMEMEMEKMIDKLEELAEKQEELAEETEKAAEDEEKMTEEEQKAKQEELEKKQEELNKEMEKLMEKQEEMEKKNEEMENEKDMDGDKEDMEEISEEMEQSEEELSQDEKKKAAKKQKSAAEKMKQMAMKMQMKMQSQEQEQMEEDMESLRQLLENLVGLSFDQEDLMNQFIEAQINTPHYVDLVQDQFKLKDDFRLVEDSLQALAKRIFQIESYVMEKVTEVKSNMKQGIDNLEQRRKPQAANNQQATMKNVNDLALMLSEVMQQMQQQMSGNMPGNQQCDNPGGKGSGKKPSDKPGSSGQKSLGDQMKKMKDGMKKGGQGGQSKQFAKMAARQAALRQALQEKQKEMQGQGQGSKELQDMIEQMNKNEIDLVNKNLTNEMLNRQQDIMTKLLEHEKAERERDKDNKRKSESAGTYERKMPPSLEEYIKKRESEIEQYKDVSPSLKPYYKFLVEEYFKELKGAK